MADVLRRFPDVAAAWIFGSEARGTAHPGSDLDVALLLRERGTTSGEVALLVGRIAAHLEGVAPGRRLDLTLLEAQGPIFQQRVLAEGRLVYDADPPRRVDFESDAYVRYFDFLPTYELSQRHALKGFSDWLEGQR
jgi:predicted nucleotidyltransferase